MGWRAETHLDGGPIDPGPGETAYSSARLGNLTGR